MLYQRKQALIFKIGEKMENELNTIIEELADISYTALDIKEGIISGEADISEMLRKITKVHQVLSNTQNQLIQLTK